MGEKKAAFRFTVQFNEGDPHHRQVAALLNEQGRRKAQFLVNAVLHYISCPETPEIAAPAAWDRRTMEQLVREILADMQPQYAPAPKEASHSDSTPITAVENISFDAAAMLGSDGFDALLNSLVAIQQQ